ncbi:unnamed protein product, partial [Medioppia subpectinata]
MFTDCLLGGEYAGRRADTGQRVMGIEFGRCIATHVNACVFNMAPIPDHWSMAEAVTVLNSYSTVYYALIKKANIKKGESVLIHSEAGSVSQAAINVCEHYGCDIYVTVGTEEEKQFLIKEYNIPENRIFRSRDMRFKSEIIEATNGRGIDVVLNSLTGKKSDLSFECLAKGGRFIQLNKLDHGQNGQNRKHNPYDFDGDIQHIVVSANHLITDIGFLPEFYEWIQLNSNPKGFVRPLNYTVFGPKRVVDAFRYMTTGRHIGKVVIKYRDEPSDVEKVFIITGGLGGMGLELMSWMHMRGARKFVLTSRSVHNCDEIVFACASGTLKKPSNSEVELNVMNGQMVARLRNEVGPSIGQQHLQWSDWSIELSAFRTGSSYIRCLFDYDQKLSKDIDFTKSPFKKIKELDLVCNIYKGGKWGAQRHILLPEEQETIDTEHAYLNVVTRGDM